MIQIDWNMWVLNGSSGFTLLKEQIVNGITAQDYMVGLTVRNGVISWEDIGKGSPEHHEMMVSQTSANLNTVEIDTCSRFTKPTSTILFEVTSEG